MFVDERGRDDADKLDADWWSGDADELDADWWSGDADELEDDTEGLLEL